MGALYEIMDFICWTMGQIFYALDNVFLGGHSILDINLAIAYFAITLWFIMEVLNPDDSDNNTDVIK